ncbi:hypothetical protein N7508_010544 [Penicillium antarcticum]|uniref:uncharacterized protein n=1 Tax=Penicillium antarcticum TaxID=416450 RepID=UPI002388E593|nr:uncharacterized protein N7508_010544 [Penicillium antarcticum]KAJ5295723.1 hypothetical protein N7508_010544 [Penicillium antarcticum]
MLASAVAVPEQESHRQSPELTSKRRQSSVSEHDTKRRRLSSQSNLSPQSQRRRSSPQPDASAESKPARSRGGREEDRKRGQRLFGGLLGTLSQSSSSAAQRRRADIERKQQDKLKTQDLQYDELKKQRKEQREAIRRKETPLYEREAMNTRHGNMIAMAHFLKTRAEPVLYYKPWQSRPGDESVIQKQIEEAQATVAREVAEFEARYPPEAFAPQPDNSNEEESVAKEQGTQGEKMQPIDTASDQPAASEPLDLKDSEPKEPTQEAPKTAKADTNEKDAGSVTMNGSADVATAVHDSSDTHHDDGGEVLEDNEDTVIY